MGLLSEMFGMSTALEATLYLLLNIFLCACLLVGGILNIVSTYGGCDEYSVSDGFTDFSRIAMWVAFGLGIAGCVGFGALLFFDEVWVGILESPDASFAKMGLHVVHFLIMGLLLTVGLCGFILQESCTKVSDADELNVSFYLNVAILVCAGVAGGRFLYSVFEPIVMRHINKHRAFEAGAAQAKARMMASANAAPTPTTMPPTAATAPAAAPKPIQAPAPAPAATTATPTTAPVPAMTPAPAPAPVSAPVRR